MMIASECVCECFVSVCRSVCSVRVMNYVYVITVCVLCVSEREREGGREI